jgi:hypothetical protein
MSNWTVHTETSMSSITARSAGSGRIDPPDRYEDHGDWRVFYNGARVVAARNDTAFHRRLDLASINGLLPGNVVAELRRVADATLRVPSDVSVTVHTSEPAE